MKKTVMTALTSLMLVAGASNTFAHTHLSSTDPQEGQVITAELTAINLTFDGPIEQGGSIELTNTSGDTIAIEQITVADMVMTGTLAEPLANGDYTATWLSISADGHPVEGEFTFSVNVPAVEEEPVIETTEEATTTDSQSTEVSSAATEEASANTDSEQESSPMPYIIGALIGMMLVSALFLFKRKK